jgi:hypothetical protein
MICMVNAILHRLFLSVRWTGPEGAAAPVAPGRFLASDERTGKPTMDTAIDAIFSTAARPPDAFNRLRRELHAVTGADRIAASRTRDTITQLRHRADFFLDAVAIHAGTGLGDWYAELANRLTDEADQIEAAAAVEGVLS